ncbi:carboxyl transferase domain-containing protein [Litorivita sp. NS0012-18]|uniref:carboxyl transferase domain-containing protein n=1 Tax=Litorivita sp. NS0012-18 TaxID=3127655 RepID=UPI0031099B4E
MSLSSPRPITKLLIANRGEIALRIARTAAEMGIETVAIAPEDDAQSLHLGRCDGFVLLAGAGPRAYLDIDAVIDAAKQSGADAVHPGYGFLAESADFAAKIEAAGLTFVGPTPQSLALFGDKLAAKAHAQRLGVPVPEGTTGPTTLAEAAKFRAALPQGASMLIKAVAGGGGRGMRVIGAGDDLEAGYARCTSEAEAAFGNGAVYVERYLPAARHIEVQILGDGTGGVIDFAERECTLQRRHQKLVEIAPSPSLSAQMRQSLTERATCLAQSDAYRSLGTFEFLMSEEGLGGEQFFFIEANPRIQVEHTVSEELFGIDLVALQLRIAAGASLADLGLDAPTAMPAGWAIQTRINMERMDAQAQALPTGGRIAVYEPPTGAGLRTDGFATAGYETSARYDSLLAKLITHSKAPDFAAALANAGRALGEFRIEGVETNIPWLRGLIAHPDVIANRITTRFIDDHAAALFETAGAYMADDAGAPAPAAHNSADLARAPIPEGSTPANAPMQATVIAVLPAAGDRVQAGQEIAILEAMKMEHVITAEVSGRISAICAQAGQTVMEGAPVLAIAPEEGSAAEQAVQEHVDLDHIRPDLAELEQRRSYGRDENRPEAVAKRHARGHQTARENIAQVCDAGSFKEYGEFAIAAQIQRRSMEDLVENTTGDGILTGLGQVNGDQFGDDLARCAFAVGDYMVLAGTQGQRHHRKLDRILKVAEEWTIPLVLFAEGGGGRPGDTERFVYSGMSTPTFSQLANLSGKVPLVGIVSGRCFAGNAALVGCCDVIIADESSNLGMAGPAMIEGGGLGIYPPEEIGPIDVQSANGVVDIRVKDEAEACEVARKYLSYFQGATTDWTAPDARALRHVVPQNRLRSYEVRDAIEGMADVGSVLELRREFGVGIVTAFMRIEGRPFGVIANNSKHLGGAIDADASDKAARFMQLCDAFDIPMISLCDTPGFMVGPEAERSALVRHVSRMFVTARSLSVPVFAVVLRKCYGLGAMGMIGGGTYDNLMSVSWPTGEFGPMGLEGAVTLGFRRELDAVTDAGEKKALYDKLVAQMYEQGKAIKVAQTLEIDAVIDPAETRDWLLAGLRSVRLRPPMSGRKRPMVDPW